jgi:hypothetical protein
MTKTVKAETNGERKRRKKKKKRLYPRERSARVKASVKNTAQLRELIAGLITVVLASLQNRQSPQTRRKKFTTRH